MNFSIKCRAGIRDIVMLLLVLVFVPLHAFVSNKAVSQYSSSSHIHINMKNNENFGDKKLISGKNYVERKLTKQFKSTAGSLILSYIAAIIKSNKANAAAGAIKASSSEEAKAAANQVKRMLDAVDTMPGLVENKVCILGSIYCNSCFICKLSI